MTGRGRLDSRRASDHHEKRFIWAPCGAFNTTFNIAYNIDLMQMGQWQVDISEKGPTVPLSD